MDFESEWNRIAVPSINYRLPKREVALRAHATRGDDCRLSRLGLLGPQGFSSPTSASPAEGQAERRSPNISPRLPGRLIEVSFPPLFPVPSQLAQSGEAPSSGPTQGSSREYSAQPQVGARAPPPARPLPGLSPRASLYSMATPCPRARPNGYAHRTRRYWGVRVADAE